MSILQQATLSLLRTLTRREVRGGAYFLHMTENICSPSHTNILQLFSSGTCCGSMCRHCPYEWESVPAIKVERYAARQRRLKEKREKKQKEDMQQQHGVTLKTGRSLGNENVKNASIPLTSGVKAK